MSEWDFRIKQKDANFQQKKLQADVPQCSMLGPILYPLYTSDLHWFNGNVVATFTDDTTVLAIGENNIESIRKVQTPIDGV